MNKEEYGKISTFDKLDYDIAMKMYFEHNDTIAGINDHLGEMYSYQDLKEAEEYALKDEMEHYRGALKEKCNAIDKAIKYIEKWQSFPHTNGSTHEELRNLKSILKGEE